MLTIRVKITLWIVLASLLSALGCSYYVYQEFLENVYLQIDDELAEVSETALYDLAEHHRSGDLGVDLQGKFAFQHFLLALYDDQGKQIYANEVAQLIEPSLHHSSTAYFINKILSAEPFSQLQGRVNDFAESSRGVVRFRVREFSVKVGTKDITIQVAKPVFSLYQELQEVVTDLLVFFALALAAIYVLGYWVAGKVLRPLVTTNALVREIRDSSLDKRIPLGSQRDELYELNSGLNSMFDRLEDSFARQKEFMGSAAHELKSPLTVLMLGHEEMLASAAAAPLQPQLKRQLYSMQRLQKLIRDMLSVTRLEGEEGVVCQRFSLSDIFDSLLDDYADYLAVKRITVNRFGEAPYLTADREKITRLCINLLDNAIKYNLDNDGFIEIFMEKKVGAVRLVLSNSSTHIADKELQRIFDKFYRIEKSRSQQYGGSGLGLSIVKRIVLLHGGTIQVANDAGVTTFTLVFPNQGDQP